MNEKLKQIHEYLMRKGLEKETVEQLDHFSVYLSMEIMEYAHRNQKRDIGEDYASHPARLLKKYQDLVGIVENDPFCIDKDKMWELGIPYEGVQEVCCLHDVIEDTEFTMDDVRDIFYECGFKDYYDIYIEKPLKLVTHDKSMDYKEYVDICMKNPISALVKLLDLNDNLTICSLTKFGDFEYKRCLKYLRCVRQIESKYHFLKNITKYRKLRA